MAFPCLCFLELTQKIPLGPAPTGWDPTVPSLCQHWVYSSTGLRLLWESVPPSLPHAPVPLPHPPSLATPCGVKAGD